MLNLGNNRRRGGCGVCYVADVVHVEDSLGSSPGLLDVCQHELPSKHFLVVFIVLFVSQSLRVPGRQHHIQGQRIVSEIYKPAWTNKKRFNVTVNKPKGTKLDHEPGLDRTTSLG